MELCVCQAPAGSRDRFSSRRRRMKRKERLNVFYNQGLFYNSLLEGISRASLTSFCHSQSSTHCSIHFITISTFSFPSSGSMSFSSSAPVTASLLQSFSSPHQPSLLHLSNSPFPLLSPPSLGSQSIYYSAKWAYQLSRVLLIEAVTENE